jgi:hypothetical protein
MIRQRTLILAATATVASIFVEPAPMAFAYGPRGGSCVSDKCTAHVLVKSRTPGAAGRSGRPSHGSGTAGVPGESGRDPGVTGAAGPATPAPFCGYEDGGTPSQSELSACGGTQPAAPAAAKGANAAPKVTGVQLAVKARKSFTLDPPVIGMAPPSQRVLVNFSTWLWVTGWAAQSATATVPGLSATVTATPVSVTWDMGDGHQITCLGPGDPWSPQTPADASSDCTYTYQTLPPAPASTFTVTATINYTAGWTATNGTGGNLGTVTAAATEPVAVVEYQTVNK